MREEGVDGNGGHARGIVSLVDPWLDDADRIDDVIKIPAGEELLYVIFFGIKSNLILSDR